MHPVQQQKPSLSSMARTRHKFSSLPLSAVKTSPVSRAAQGDNTRSYDLYSALRSLEPAVFQQTAEQNLPLQAQRQLHFHVFQNVPRSKRVSQNGGWIGLW